MLYFFEFKGTSSHVMQHRNKNSLKLNGHNHFTLQMMNQVDLIKELSLQ
jgi:hypothetical protein